MHTLTFSATLEEVVYQVPRPGAILRSVAFTNDGDSVVLFYLESHDM